MDTLESRTVSTRLQRIATLASNAPDMVFTSLAHHIDITTLKEAWRRVRKDGAVGVDGQTAKDYARNLQANLEALHEKFKSGLYRAPPVRRVYIPKADGRMRPLGIPTLEDKILQKAVTMVLEAVYEQDFLDCSYGFRPGRSAHGALQTLWSGLMKMGGGWVLDVDIKGYFDSIVHEHLRSFLDQRVRDGVLRRAIGKWLKAGVMEEGSVRRSDKGSPQGGVISPLLSNVYLHEVLDTWFERDVKPRMRGACFLIRFADDFAIVCADEQDARRIMEVLPKRFERFGLELHPVKTRMVDFRRPPGRPGRSSMERRPATFDLLGFTHHWGSSRKGRWVVKRKTAKDRFSRAVRKIAAWCREHRHLPIAAQHRALSRKLRGHDAYYGITGNAAALGRLRNEVSKAWRQWLARRGGRGAMTWEKFQLLLRRYPLPPLRVVHSVFNRT